MQSVGRRKAMRGMAKDTTRRELRGHGPYLYSSSRQRAGELAFRLSTPSGSIKNIRFAPNHHRKKSSRMAFRGKSCRLAYFGTGIRNRRRSASRTLTIFLSLFATGVLQALIQAALGAKSAVLRAGYPATQRCNLLSQRPEAASSTQRASTLCTHPQLSLLQPHHQWISLGLSPSRARRTRQLKRVRSR
jgi:hypothetical protein